MLKSSLTKGLRILSAIAIMMVLLIPFQNCSEPFPLDPIYMGSADGTVSPERARFAAAKQILDAKCLSCHTSGGSAAFSPFSFSSEQQFVSSGLISAGNPSQSKLIYRLKNYPDTTISNRNMPTTGSLSSDEYNILYSWVSQMRSSDSSIFTCNENSTLLQRSVQKDLKRHTRRQYVSSLKDLLSRGIAENTVNTMVNQAVNNVSMPTDDGSNFSRFDQTVVRQHIKAYFDLADALSTTVTNSTHYANFTRNFINLSAGSCTSPNPASLSTACATRFVVNFGLRALRRPLTSVEQTAYLNTYTTAGGNAAGINAVVFKFLMAPNFLYQIENQGTVVSGSLLRLSSYEIASKLSYMFWNTMPDETLLGQAASADLGNDGPFLTALTYVANHAKAQDSMKEFMYEWLQLNKTPQFATTNQSLNWLANNEGVTLDASLRTAMIEEMQELGAFVFQNNMNFTDLFTTDISFARDSRLVQIYGVSGAAPTTVTPQNAVRFPANQRGGLLTRAGFLVGGTELANPVKRGIKVRKDILCLPLENPPADLPSALEPPPHSINLTTRERYDIATSPAACASCHQYINSLGHALGSYNSFGKYMTQEPIFDSTGAFANRYLPVSTAVDLSTSLRPGLSAANALELSSRVASQPTAQKCFSERALRFVEGRTENTNKEGCRLNGLYAKLSHSRSLKDFFRSLAEDTEFRHRLMGTR